MTQKMRFILTPCFFMLLFLLSLNLNVLEALAESPRRIFILHSYESGHVCGQPQHDGVVAALKKAGFEEKENLEIKTYCMDTKRKNNTPELIEEQARIALKKIDSFRPDVLVTLDDNAFRTVALKLVDRPIPIVFCGMNGQPENYNKSKRFMDSRSEPGHNITGVYEKLHFADAIRVHSKLFPGLKKVLVFLDTSPTGRAILEQIKLEIAREKISCSYEIKVSENWEDYQKGIFSANKDSEVDVIYPAALLLKDRNGTTHTAPQIFAWTVKNSKKPEIALNYAFTRLGLFGGAAVDFYAMGLQAGQMAAAIFRGKDPGKIPIEEAERYALVFNVGRAKQLGIEIPSDVLMSADEVVVEKKR